MSTRREPCPVCGPPTPGGLPNGPDCALCRGTGYLVVAVLPDDLLAFIEATVPPEDQADAIHETLRRRAAFGTRDDDERG